MGVAIDEKNNELWVGNFGNRSAAVFASPMWFGV